MKVHLPPGAMGLDFEDGRRFKARNFSGNSADDYKRDYGNRHVHITEQAHLDALKKNDWVGTPYYTLQGQGWDCTACGRGNWGWQDACPGTAARPCGQLRPVLVEAV